MTKIEGSAGSISQRHGSADPDPDPRQNVMNPQHCMHHTGKQIEAVLADYSGMPGYSGMAGDSGAPGSPL
jgi:hypothetical protein